MDFTSTQIIAKEGWLNIGAVFAVFLLACFTSAGSHAMLIILAALIFIYRNPERIMLEDDPLAIVAPIDGKVIDINRDYNLTKDQGFLRIKIRSLLFDVGMVRSPIKAELKEVKVTHGLFLFPSDQLAATMNEKAEFLYRYNNFTCYMRIIAGAFSKKIHIGKERGIIKTGSRIAFITDGIVELFLPLDSRIKLSIGDSVKSGETIVGYLAY